MRRRKSRDEILIESIMQTYLDFSDFIRNPSNKGYLAFIYKLRPQARELIKSKLLDIKIEAEKEMIKQRNKMRGAMGYYDDT